MEQIHAHIQTGEAAYTCLDKSLFYDAIPGFWKQLTIEKRQQVIQRINRITAEEGVEQMWTNKTHLVQLAEFVQQKDVLKLCICHQVAKQDPSVIVGTRQLTITIDNNKDEKDNASPRKN